MYFEADSAEGDGVFLTRAVGREEQGVRLFHDLPLTREEYLSCYLLESDAAATAVAASSATREHENSNSNDGASTDYHIDVIRVGYTIIITSTTTPRFDVSADLLWL